MNCQPQVLTCEEPFQFSFISMPQGVYPRDSNDLPKYSKNYLFVTHLLIIWAGYGNPPLLQGLRKQKRYAAMARRCLGVNPPKALFGHFGVLEKICVAFPQIDRQRIKSELAW